MGKRIFSILLACTMVFWLMPASAFAEEDSNVAQIGDTKYPTIKEALEAVTDDTETTITLLKDVSLSKDNPISVGKTKNIVIDLNGKTITTNDTSAEFHLISNEGTLVLKNGKIRKMGNQSTNPTQWESGDAGGYVITNHGTMTLQGLDIVSQSNYSSAVANGWFNAAENTEEKNSVMKIINTKIDGGKYSVKNDDYGEMTIKSSEIINSFDPKYPAVTNFNDLVIEDTVVRAGEGMSAVATFGDPDKGYNSGSTVIKSGEFYGSIIRSLKKLDKVSIEGGSFTDISRAVAHAKNGATIKLADDVTLLKDRKVAKDKTAPDAIVVKKDQDITLDLNGKTIGTQGWNGSGDHMIQNAGNLVLKNGTIKKHGEAGNADDSTKGYVITNHGTMTLEKLTIDSKSTFSSAVANGWYNADDNTGNKNSVMTITDTDIKGGKWVVKNDDYGEMTINSGKFEIIDETPGTVLNWNKLTINGGEFLASGKKAVATQRWTKLEGDQAKLLDHTLGETTINGGKFVGKIYTSPETKMYKDDDPAKEWIGYSYYPKGVTIKIQGGSFDTNPSAHVASGYVVEGSEGNFVVKKETSKKSRPSSSATPAPTPTPEPKPEKKETIKLAPEATVSNGQAKAVVSEKNIKDALTDAKAGKTENIVVAPVVKGKADKVEVALPTEAIKEVASKTEATLNVKTEVGSINIPNDTLDEIIKEAGGKELVMNVAKVENSKVADKLPATVNTTGAVAVEFTISSAEKKISSFGGKTLDIQIPVDTNNHAEGKTYITFIISSDNSVDETTAKIRNGLATIAMSHFSTVVITKDEVVNFADVAPEDYFYKAVLWAANKKITSGMTETTFGPSETCNRGQMVTFLWRAAGMPEPTNANLTFNDVTANDYFHKAVLWAAEKGITTGKAEGMFKPEDQVTRAEAVTFLARALDGKASGANSFTDVAADAFYYDAVLWATEKGITTGMGDGVFAPENPCLRGQIVTFLHRAYGNK